MKHRTVHPFLVAMLISILAWAAIIQIAVALWRWAT